MTTVTTSDKVASAIDRNFTSPNVSDSNLEAANVVDALDNVAKALWCLSRRGMLTDDQRPGAIEFLAEEIHLGLDHVANALNRVAAAISDNKLTEK
jgi:hypothetical protein